MDKFESLVPQGISINCLEDLGCLTVKELKKILAAQAFSSKACDNTRTRWHTPKSL